MRRLRCLLRGHTWWYVARYPHGLKLRSYQGLFSRTGVETVQRTCLRCGAAQHLRELPPGPVNAADLPRSAWAAEG